MTLLQIVVNILLAILVYVLVSALLNAIGIGGVVNLTLSLLAALGVFFANFSARLRV